MKKQLFSILTIVLILTGCSKENELKNSVFINDPEFVGLPIYSEWGYNTFGAYYDRELFISDNYSVPAKIISTSESMSFTLTGHKTSNNYYGNYEIMTMEFNIQGYSPDDYKDLVVFNDTVIDLTNPLYKVTISMDTIASNLNILSGSLTFKRAQNLLVDKQQVEVILSGYFDFKTTINGTPFTISDGRFDVGISPDNFYKL